MSDKIPPVPTAEEREVRACLDAYAADKPFRLNPDERVVAGVVRGLLARRKKYGKDYCPCRIVSGDAEKDARIVCPCVYHVEEVERDGYCHCHLFVAGQK